jgi:hypothetical protein
MDRHCEANFSLDEAILLLWVMVIVRASYNTNDDDVRNQLL